MTTTIDPIDTAPKPVANRFTPDAQDRTARLRAIVADLPDEADPKPLTPAEIRLARQTSGAALEKAAVFVEAAPGMEVVDAAELRDAIAFELAYGGVRDEALTLARRIDHAILRRKLKATKSTRGLYRIAKGYVTLDVGDAVRPHVAEMKRSLVRNSSKKKGAQPEPAPKTATQK